MSIVISAYFGMALFLSQFLHSYYVKKDPKYKGNLAVGFPFFNVGSVKYTFGYQTAFVLLFSGFFITLTALRFCPPIENFTFAEFFQGYGGHIFLTLIAVYSLAQVVGPSASKSAIDGVAVIMVMIILYSMTKDANSNIILTILVAIATISYSSALWWIGNFQRYRIKGHGVKYVYFIPTLYGIGSLTFDLMVGTKSF